MNLLGFTSHLYSFNFGKEVFKFKIFDNIIQIVNSVVVIIGDGNIQNMPNMWLTRVYAVF